MVPARITECGDREEVGKVGESLSLVGILSCSLR